MKTEFKKNGELSAYAFACGCVESHGSGLNISKEHGAYHVKGFIGDARIFESVRTIREARQIRTIKAKG